MSLVSRESAREREREGEREREREREIAGSHFGSSLPPFAPLLEEGGDRQWAPSRRTLLGLSGGGGPTLSPGRVRFCQPNLAAGAGGNSQAQASSRAIRALLTTPLLRGEKNTASKEVVGVHQPSSVTAAVVLFFPNFSSCTTCRGKCSAL